MKRISSAIFSIAILLLTGISAFAQETEARVVDEVVAQINDGVLTLSRINREMKNVVDGYVQEGKSREEAQKMIGEKKGELIANLINEELLVQKAKELGLDSEIDASINQRFLEIMKAQNIKTLDALYQEMEKGGLNPDDVREIWRKQATKEAVIRKEVQSKVYWEASSKDLKDYYEKNKAKFTTPETITLSKIFIGFAGRSEANVREKIKALAAQLKGGADFAKLAAENSDDKEPTETLALKDLNEKFAGVIKNLKPGEISEPMEIDQMGMSIVRLDKKTQASAESTFDENQVRLARMNEKVPEALKAYMSKLREDSYIKLSDSYRPLVAPILFADERSKEKPAETKTTTKPGGK
jgi:peptidyl-prolyl cis-trans isomerase SurA